MANGFGTAYLATAMINAVTSTVNGSLARKQQERLALKNQSFTEKMEKNRQDFQLSLSQENIRVQKEMSQLNHQLRLEEQKNNFEIMCRSSEWQHFEAEWPLWVRPMVLRGEQILEDDTVALRVLFAKSRNKIFSSYIFPEIEQGLVEFVDRYHNIFQSRNIIFYHNAFKDSYYGGSFNANVHYALKDLPVLIIDSNVLSQEICVSATIWGFGSDSEQHTTLFKLPYKWNMLEDGKLDPKYIQALSSQLQAYLKFVIGYAYDTYNLIMYNKAPILPQIASLELREGVEGTPLRYNGIKNVIGERYGEIYRTVLGTTSGKETGFAEKPESFKNTILHRLRLDYAVSIREHCSRQEYTEFLDESLTAWTQLRTTDRPERFLETMIKNPSSVQKYFSEEDKEYFNDLEKAYREGEQSGKYAPLCRKLCGILEGASLKTAQAEIIVPVSLPKKELQKEKKTQGEPRQFIEL